MTRYQLLFKEFTEHVQRYEAFVARGGATVLRVTDQFVAYLEAPPNMCQLAPADGDLNSPPIARHEAGKLQADGWFAATVIIREQHPMGGILGLTFFASIQDGSVKLKTREGCEFRVKDPQIEPPIEFFDHVIERIHEHMKADPEKLVAGGMTRRIGFL